MSEEHTEQEHFQPIPSPFDVRIQEADLYITHGLYDEAASAYQNLLEDIEEADLDSKEKNRLILLVQEKLNKALDKGSTGETELPPTMSQPEDEEVDPVRLFNQGLALKDVDLFEEAIAEFNRAAQAGHNQVESYEQCVECSLALEKFDLALEYLEKILGLDDLEEADRERITLRAGEISEKLEDNQRAFEYFSQLWLKDPEKFSDLEEKLTGIKEKLRKEHLEKLEKFIELGDVVECRVLLEILAKELDATKEELTPYCEKLGFPVTEIFLDISPEDKEPGRESGAIATPRSVIEKKKSSVEVVKELGLPDVESPGTRAAYRSSDEQSIISDPSLVGEVLKTIELDLLPPLLKKDDGREYAIVRGIGEGNTCLALEVKDEQSDRLYVAQSLVAASGKIAKNVDFYVKWATLISNMNCKQVAKVYDIAILDERPFLIMEHLGPSLDKVLAEKNALPVDVVLSISHNLLKALAYCHTHLGLDGNRHKVFHLDLRPSRILWDPHRKGRQKVINQGLLPLLAGDINASLSYGIFDCPDHLLAYKAPEQFQPELLLKLHRPPVCTDIYAIGVVMYEMLTGCTPFMGPTYDDYMTQHLTRYPIPPKVLVSNIPEDLDAIILRCLRKKPMERWRSVTELELAIEKVKI